MANKTTSEKNKPARKKLRPNEYYNPKTNDTKQKKYFIILFIPKSDYWKINVAN